LESAGEAGKLVSTVILCHADQLQGCPHAVYSVPAVLGTGAQTPPVAESLKVRPNGVSESATVDDSQRMMLASNPSASSHQLRIDRRLSSVPRTPLLASGITKLLARQLGDMSRRFLKLLRRKTDQELACRKCGRRVLGGKGDKRFYVCPSCHAIYCRRCLRGIGVVRCPSCDGSIGSGDWLHFECANCGTLSDEQRCSFYACRKCGEVLCAQCVPGRVRRICVFCGARIKTRYRVR
jgi:hypothetical protein